MATDKNIQSAPEEQISHTDDTQNQTLNPTCVDAPAPAEEAATSVGQIQFAAKAGEEQEPQDQADRETVPQTILNESSCITADETPVAPELEAEPSPAETLDAEGVGEEGPSMDPEAVTLSTEIPEEVSDQGADLSVEAAREPEPQEEMEIPELNPEPDTAVITPSPQCSPAPAEETAGQEIPAEETQAVEKEHADGASREEAGLDFSEEEAQLDELAAQLPEFELGEEDETELQHGNSPEAGHGFDITGKTKAQLLDIFAVLLSEKPVQTIRREVEAIKVAFYKILRGEHDELRRKFIEDGGQPEDFAPPVDNDEQRLKDLFSEYRRRRDDFIAQLDRSKEENLQIKLKIIEDLKELINGSETLGNTFNAFRELQQWWREVGPVPQANVKDLWETYNHHVENFYSYIKINKELRDLDLKKNYEAKVALCEEAEALLLEPSVINSFHKLQKLHEQWRETGPVAREFKETLWERFREASSRINKQHQEYFDTLKDEQKRNLELKTELCVNTEQLAAGMWTSRKEWNRASDKLLEIQKVWKTIGFAPKKDNAKVYERFRNACDRFFEQKRAFYQQMKAEMEHNLHLKNEICQAAEAIQESEDWKKTTEELIALQKKWKEIGPVARRHFDPVWKRFRAACDRFFERKTAHFAGKDAEQETNLALKRELLQQIAEADINSGGFEMVKEFQRRWGEIGFVPIRQKEAIQKEYKAVMDNAFSILRGSGQSVRMDRFRDKVKNMKTSGDKRLRFERDRLYNKVKQLESEIALLENNIGFFSNSKNAEAMIRDVKEKIERSREEMAATIEKINLIDNQG